MKKPVKPRAAPIVGTKALEIFWDKRIREAGKKIRRSPLFPKTQRRSGKAQFNWLATSIYVVDGRDRFHMGSAVCWTPIDRRSIFVRGFVPAPLIEQS